MGLRTKIIITAGDQTSPGFNSVNSKVDKLDQRLDKATRTAAGFFGVFSAFQAAKGLIVMSDTMTTVNTQLRLVTDSSAEYEAAQASVLAISIATGTTLKNNGDLYANLSRSSEILNGSQSRLVGVQETINQSLAIGNRSTIENNSAIRQLAQGLGSGVLRGEEFNSVMENSPRLAQILTDALGKTKGELYAMARQGELTADIVIAAIEDQSSVIEAEYQQVELTVKRTWAAVNEAAINYIGTNDGVRASTGLLAESLQFTAENFDEIARYAEIAGAVIVSRYAGKAIGAIHQKIAATVADIAAERAKQVATTATLKAEAAAAGAARERARAELTLAQSMVLTSGGSNQALISEKRLHAARIGLTAATRQQTAANAAHAASIAKVSRAGGVVRAGMSLLGGPAGVITLGALALVNWATNSKTAAGGAQTLKGRIDELTASFKDFRFEQVDSDLKKNAKLMEDIAEKLAKVQKKATATDQPVSEFELKELKELGAAYGLAQKKVDTLTEQKKELEKQSKNTGTALTTTGNKGSKAADKLEAAAKKITDGLLTDLQKYEAGIERASNLLKKGYLDTDQYALHVNNLRKSLLEAEQATKDKSFATADLNQHMASMVKVFEDAQERIAEEAQEQQRAKEATEAYNTSIQRQITVLDAKIAGGDRAAKIQTVLNQAERSGAEISKEKAAADIDAIDALERQIVLYEQLSNVSISVRSNAANAFAAAVEYELVTERQLTKELKREYAEREDDVRKQHADGEISAKEMQEQILQLHDEFTEKRKEIDKDWGDHFKEIGTDAAIELVKGWIKIFGSRALKQAVEGIFNVGDGAFNFGSIIGAATGSGGAGGTNDILSIGGVLTKIGEKIGLAATATSGAGSAAAIASSSAVAASGSKIGAGGLLGHVGSSPVAAGGGFAAVAPVLPFLAIGTIGKLLGDRKDKHRAEQSQDITNKVNSGAVTGGFQTDGAKFFGTGDTGVQEMEAFLQLTATGKDNVDLITQAFTDTGARIFRGNDGLLKFAGTTEQINHAKAIAASTDEETLQYLNEQVAAEVALNRHAGEKGAAVLNQAAALKKVSAEHAKQIKLVSEINYDAVAASAKKNFGATSKELKSMLVDGRVTASEIGSVMGKAGDTILQKMGNATSVTASEFLKLIGVTSDTEGALLGVAQAGAAMGNQLTAAASSVASGLNKAGGKANELSGALNSLDGTNIDINYNYTSTGQRNPDAPSAPSSHGRVVARQSVARSPSPIIGSRSSVPVAASSQYSARTTAPIAESLMADLSAYSRQNAEALRDLSDRLDAREGQRQQDQIIISNKWQELADAIRS